MLFRSSIKGYRGETLVHALEQKNIYVSTGSSCSSKLMVPEKTILALTDDTNLASSTIRISLSYLVKYEDIDALVDAINDITK